MSGNASCKPSGNLSTNKDLLKLRDYASRITDTLNTLAEDRKKKEAIARLDLIIAEIRMNTPDEKTDVA